MNAQALLKQLDFIGRAIAKDPVLPILKYAMIDDGLLIGSNIATFLLCKTEIPGTFLIPFKEVRKVVSILPKDVDCKFIYDKDAKRVSVQTPSGSFNFSEVPDIEEFPKLPERSDVEIGILNALDLHRIQTVLPFASADELRPAMGGVYINKQIAATDGHRLAWFESSGGIEDGIIVDKLTASVLAGFGKAKVLFDGDGHVEFHNNKGQVIIGRLILELFPDYRMSIPSDYKTKVTIAKDVLLHAVNLGIQMANRTTRQIIFNFLPGDGVQITARDIDFDTNFKHSIPCVVDGPPVEIAFDGLYMKSILQIIDTDEVIIKLKQSNNPSVINDSFMLMPIMLQTYAID